MIAVSAQRRAGSGDLVEEARALVGMGADLVGAQVRRLPDGRFFDHLGVGFCRRQSEKLVMRGRPLIFRYAQPLVIGIEHAVVFSVRILLGYQPGGRRAIGRPLGAGGFVP